MTALKDTADFLGRLQDHYGITAIFPARIILMLALAGKIGAAQPDMSEQMGYDRDSTTFQSAVDRLVKKGIVEKEYAVVDGYHCMMIRLAQPLPAHLRKALPALT
ncbi:MAG: MarR family transcriptional regulator [Sphingomonas parapaucimobilis]